MKKYLILGSMFSRDLKKTYFDFVKLNEAEGEPFAVLSPASMIGEEGDGYVQIVATAINMRSLVDDVAEYDRPIIYIGPALKEIEFDKIFTIKKATVMAQEKMILALTEGTEVNDILMKFIMSSESEADYKSVEEVFTRIKEDL